MKTILTIITLMLAMPLLSKDIKVEIKSVYQHSKKTWGTYQHIEDQVRATYRSKNEFYNVVKNTEVGPGRLILKDNKLNLIKEKTKDYVISYLVYSLDYKTTAARKMTVVESSENFQTILKQFYDREIRGILKKSEPKRWKYIMNHATFTFSNMSCVIPKGFVNCQVELKISDR